MDDLISRQATIDAINRLDIPEDMCVFEILSHIELEIGNLPSAQQERIIYGNMSDEEFEKWLYGHGICSPNIREPIPCAVVPLLIDNAISELPSAQPEIIRCKDCKHYNGEDRDICCPLADYAQSKCGADWFCADGERKEAEHEQG